MLHQTEAETAYDHITLNFECQDGSSLQVVLQKEVLDCISLITLNLKHQEQALFLVFLYDREAGTACDNGLLPTVKSNRVDQPVSKENKMVHVSPFFAEIDRVGQFSVKMNDSRNKNSS